MTEGHETFLALSQRARRDVIEAAASRLDTSPSYVEKDFWVCLVLDTLFSHCPQGHPRLLFKGGTSLSKVFGLIERFSEDIDLVVFRDDLGFEGKRDLTAASNLSNRKRKALFKKLQTACSEFIRGDLRWQSGLINFQLVVRLFRMRTTEMDRHCWSSTPPCIRVPKFPMWPHE